MMTPEAEKAYLKLQETLLQAIKSGREVWFGLNSKDGLFGLSVVADGKTVVNYINTPTRAPELTFAMVKVRTLFFDD